MSASYNHHWDSWMIGSEARFRKVVLTGPDDPDAAALAEAFAAASPATAAYVAKLESFPAAGAAAGPIGRVI